MFICTECNSVLVSLEVNMLGFYEEDWVERWQLLLNICSSRLITSLSADWNLIADLWGFLSSKEKFLIYCKRQANGCVIRKCGQGLQLLWELFSGLSTDLKN